MMDALKKAGLGLVALGLALSLAGAVWTWDPLPSNPDASLLGAEAATYKAEIIRDEWGVPHIFGRRDRDTAFGVAYAHAEDDYETIQEVVAATRGQLARYRGAGAAPTDYVVQFMGIWDTVSDRYQRDVPPDVKAMAEAYAAGLNLYASQNPDTTWRGLAPFQAEDIIAGFILKTPLFYGLDGTLQSLFADSREVSLTGPPGDTAWVLDPSLNRIAGSNAFAVAPARSGDGRTRLLINSHQPMTGPVAWWEAHMVSQEGLDIQGGLFPGTPVILHGFNRHLGWANTVSKPDLVDVYRLELNPDNPDQYRLDGAWEDFDQTTVRLRIRLFGPFSLPVTRHIKRSRHGPVVEARHGTYAVRYAGMGEIRQLEQYYRLNQATDWDSFDQAMALNALPSINYVYADKSGRIALIHNGQYPNRRPGWNWQDDLPGDRSDLIWQGYLPYADGPKLIDPLNGFIFNANNTPFSATDGPDNLRAENFPDTMGLETHQTNRALRIMELTGDLDPIGRERLLSIKFDTGLSASSRGAAFLQDVLNEDWSAEPDLAGALDQLTSWDRTYEPNNRLTALPALTILRHVTAEFTGDPGPPPKTAFREAVAWLNRHFGRLDPEWGEVNRLVRGDIDLPIGGGPDILRAIYPSDYGPSGRLRANAGDTWMALVDWAPDGTQSAQVVHQFGAATLDPSSPHYADQAPLFASRDWRTAHFERADIQRNARRTSVIGGGD